MKKRNSGFSLIEVLVALTLVGLASSVLIPRYEDSTSHAKTQQEVLDISLLNDALEAFKSDYGSSSIPTGAHDETHHREVLNKLSYYVSFNEKIIKNIKSVGDGENFHFTCGPIAEEQESEPLEELTYMTSHGPTKNMNEKPVINLDDYAEMNDVQQQEEKSLVKEVDEIITMRRRKKAHVRNTVRLETPGSHQWVVPAHVKSITVEAVGAGGSGANSWMKAEWGKEKKLYSGNLSISDPCGKCGYNEVSTRRDSEGRYYRLAGKQKYFQGPGKLFLKLKTIDNDGQFYRFTVHNKAQKIIKKQYIRQGEGPQVEIDLFENESMYLTIDGCQSKSGWFKHKSFVIHEVKFRPYTRENHPSGGGGAGGYLRKTFSNLGGGETLFIQIGEGRRESDGGNTIISLNQVKLTAFGGKRSVGTGGANGGQAQGGDENGVGASGQDGSSRGTGGRGKLLESSGKIWRGSGGNGDNPHGTPGQHGMVSITFYG